MADEVRDGNVAVAEQNEEDIEVRLRTKLESEYNSRLEREVQSISKKMQEENVKIVNEAIERFKKEIAPPSEQDVQKLLEQEYVEFKFEVKTKGKDSKTFNFTICELPIAVEKKIYKRVKQILIPVAQDLSALSLNLLEGDAAKKVVQLMNTFDPMLDLMISVCAIVLNPYEEEEEIDEEWVRKNLSATRLVKIVSAQMEANKMRDFFSLLFRNTKLMSR